MKSEIQVFDEQEVLHHLKHYLPAQAPLKDFVHHNTLHAFQEQPFFKALQQASESLDFNTTLSIAEYRSRFQQGKISEAILERIIISNKGEEALSLWKERLLTAPIRKPSEPSRVGRLRQIWKTQFGLDLDMRVHPKLFKLIGGFLDQGVAEKRFPFPEASFLEAIRTLEETAFLPLFKSKKVRELLLNENTSITQLLNLIVGDARYFEAYLFDQQFAHPGWSGMIAVLEQQAESLLDHRSVSLYDFIFVELLMEIEALEETIGFKKLPLSKTTTLPEPIALFTEPKKELYWECVALWQEAFEWQYHDQVLVAIQNVNKNEQPKQPNFQAFFCIDDREESIRRHIERVAPEGETIGTPGHFGMVAVYQPDGGQFVTQIAPGNAVAKHLVKEVNRKGEKERDFHFHYRSHRLLTGWVLSQTLGFWSVFKLLFNLFKPTVTPAHSSAFEHMEYDADLVLEHLDNRNEKGYQLGFTVDEMTNIVQNLLKSTGTTANFAPLVYLIGHGGSSTNNPYYAGYNCGACSGRAGSVNARAVSAMANRKDVRENLEKEGISIPKTTLFLGGLHDTTRDEIRFYDDYKLPAQHLELHQQNVSAFAKALDNNAKERARQFLLTDVKRPSFKVHKDVRDRSTALFEPRPELNHSNNTLCIVGRRILTQQVFLDQRAFLNSYDYAQDPYGNYLKGILGAATPVCGGINLEYYFSRVDNEKLGAGSKLPHNVIGLFGVANGIKGDLRPGLPSQMIDVHDPLRLLMVVEHFPDVVLQVIKSNPAVWEWYANQWMKLAVIHPETNQIQVFNGADFEPYETITTQVPKQEGLEKIFETESENLPVYSI
ncbi:YbcC family protein [Tenacibaculum aquimarinum]|uniref:YbcC family protein n=1 Tax=Tenacibaculum aquimarinum TaxID=2910675 RepID=UPI001F0ADE58|nr:DUF2309 domain-containing protein [Tenacibaculum aquimarinum]MCH3884501.1 DUF2309 domain-containing protein [Tenacibaculum aquimarinum]